MPSYTPVQKTGSTSDHPDDRAHGDGKRSHVSQHEEKHQRPFKTLEAKGHAQGAQREAHARRRGKQQRFPANPVHHPEGDQGKGNIDDADNDRLVDGGVRGAAAFALDATPSLRLDG